MIKNEIVLHLGSNQGDRLSFLKRAILNIKEQVGEILTCSSIYETQAWGKTDQPSFYNLALKLITTLHPFEVIRQTQHIEKQIGRNKDVHWGPRNIDIDILYIDDLIIKTPRLLVPHPQLHIRNFVLYPLIEVDNARIHPIFGRSNKELLQDCKDDLSIKRINASLDIE